MTDATVKLLLISLAAFAAGILLTWLVFSLRHNRLLHSLYERLREELKRDMMIAGLASVREFNRQYVLRAPGTPGAEAVKLG